MIKEEIIDFLKNVPPFNFVSNEDLERLVEKISIEYYPKGYMILTQNGPPSDSLKIIKKGAVKLYVRTGESEEIIIDYRGEGESFGFISMLSGDRSRANVQAVEDTICYLIPKDELVSLMQKNPLTNQYFVKSFFINFIDKTYEETRKRFSLLGEGDKLLFTTTAGELIRREPVCVSPHLSIRQTAKLMSKEKISSVVITENRIPIGIVTDKDLREKVLARGEDPDAPIHTIMSSPVIKIDSNEYCFEALLKMIRYNIHHLAVVENGELKGVISNHDFMLLQGNSPTVLVKDIEEQQDIDALKEANNNLIKVVSLLLREGARAYNLTGLITEVYEKLLNKVITFIQKRIGPCPLNYSMFLIDSGGRMELTLYPDIRLGIILEDTYNVNLIKSAEMYFREVSSQLKENFSFFGITTPYAGKDLLRQDYIKTFRDWMDFIDHAAESPFSSNIEPGLVEMRCIRGDEEQIEKLRNHLFNRVRKSEEFMDYLATVTVENRPPLGFFKRFVVEKSGEHKDELNLLLKGIRPIIDATRLFCLEKAIKTRPTIKRLKELKERYSFGFADDLSHAIDYLYTLLIHEQIKEIESGFEPTVFINPAQLGNFERKTLKESFQLIADVYDVIEKSYRTERVS